MNALLHPPAEGLVLMAVTFPVLAALIGVLVTRRGLAVLGSAAALPLLVLGLAAPPDGVEVRVDWLLLGARFGVDTHSAPFAVLTGALWVAASVACAGYFDAPARRRIAPWWLLSLAGSVGLVLALDPVTFFVFFALMSFASYGLVVHRGDAGALRAGRIYMWFVVAGEVALLVGFVVGRTHPDTTLALLLAGFGIKAGLLLLHSWLPLAHGAAPAPASAVLSGAMLKAGILGWLRFVDADAPWASTAGLALVAFGMAGAVAGALVGITQRHPKVVLAYSSISQMGIIVAAFGMLLAGVAPAASAAAAATVCGVFAVHHAFAKAALFILVGVMERVSGGARRLALMVMALPALALIGLPFTSGALAKANVKALAAGLPEPWDSALGWALPTAAVGTSLLMMRLFATLPAARETRCPVALWAPGAALAFAGIAVVVLVPMSDAGSSWGARWAALGPAAIAVVLVATWGWLSRATRLRAVRVPAGDLAAGVELALGRVVRGYRSRVASSADAREGTPAEASCARRWRLFAQAELLLSGPAASAVVTLTLATALGWVLFGAG